MKKLSIMLMMALSLCFASCEDEWTEALPQSNPQEGLMSADGLTLERVLPEAISLKEYSDAGENVPMFRIVEAKNLPANSKLKFVMQLSKTEDFAKTKDVEVSVKDSLATVTPAAFEEAYLNVIGKSPKQKDAYVRFAGYVVKGTSEARLGDPELFYMSTGVKVTPMPSDLVIEENYYLIGTVCGWDMAKAIKLDHTGDPYDNPVFTVKLDLSDADVADGWWWKIVPESTFNTGGWVDAPNAAYGVAENGDTAMEGMLIAKTATFDPGAGCLKTGGQLLLTLNMEDGTYAFTSAVEYLYTPGDANGWDHNKSQKLFTSNYTDYEGYIYVSSNGFKFTNAPDWAHINYGIAKENPEEGKLYTDPNADNILVATGLYYAHVNTALLTYSLYNVTTIGLIGDATENGWDASTPLSTTNGLVWTATVNLKGSGKFKFRANDAWDVNLGGDLDNLTAGGSDIPTPGEGTYTVTLDLSKLPYTATIVKK